MPFKPFPKSPKSTKYYALRKSTENGYQLVSMQDGVESLIGQPNLLLIVMDDLLTKLREDIA